MPKEVHLTKEGYDKLHEELKALKAKRKPLSDAIAKARAHGDLSENAEYDAAKEEMAFNENRLAILEDKLSRAKVIDDSRMERDTAYVGSTVKLKDVASGEELEYMLVSEEEADFAANKISIASPVGKAFLGKKKGEIAKIQVPAGTIEYKILEVSR